MRLIDKDFNIQGVSIILGFFDGLHCGHRAVINQAVEFAKKNNTKTLLLTFKNSPAEYFQKEFNYIYPREISYKKIESLNVDFLLEENFEDLVNIPAIKYLDEIVRKYLPKSITTGFNHTFGANKQGNPGVLKEMSAKYGYKYFEIPACFINEQIVSSTLIKKVLLKGDIIKANGLLTENFTLKIKIIEGEKIGRELGFPTANAIYPQNIVKIPYGVYKVLVCNRLAIMNFGIKPTFGKNNELLEIHIPNYEANLYGEDLEVQVIEKIRDERKFASKEELIFQINEDLKCLGL